MKQAIVFMWLCWVGLNLSGQTPTFQELCAKADSLYQEDKEKLWERNPFHQSELEENDYKAFRRWQWFWRDRLYPGGRFPDLKNQAKIYHQLKQSIASRASGYAWQNISQQVADGGYNGMGRVNSMAFHPTNSNIFFVAGRKGGIWKTTDGGQHYVPIGDQLPYLAVGDVVVDQQNPNVIYATLGGDEGWWNYGLGVFKTEDGGASWNPTGMQSSFADGDVYYELIMNPMNPQSLWLAASTGLFFSADGGDSWQKKRNGSYSDVCLSLLDTNIVFAAADDYFNYSEVYRSNNNGASFTKISNIHRMYNRLHLFTTPSVPDLVSIYDDDGTNQDLYWYRNGVVSHRCQLPFADAVVMSNTHPGVLYCGEVDIHQSTDTGATWRRMTNWYDNGVDPTVHADQRFVAINPLNNDIFWGNDGGVYRYRESTDSFIELNNTLRITEFYKIANSQQDSIYIIGGTQDNGGRQRVAANTWRETNGGDAMAQAVNPADDNTIYTEYYDGDLYRSRDKWVNDTYHSIVPDSANGSWVTPFTIVWSPNTLVAAYKSVYVTQNEGDTWTNIGHYLAGNEALDELGVSLKNSGSIYATDVNTIFRTYNMGANWDTVHFSSPDDYSVHITSITPDADHAQEVWITLSGYNDSMKVFSSTDGGVNWVNKTDNLPNVPVNCMMVDTGSAVRDRYIGTDVGVFFRNDTMSQWNYFASGLPNTPVTDFSIYYPTGLLRAATFGRGIWETKLSRGYPDKTTSGIATAQVHEVKMTPNPSYGRVYLNRNEMADATWTVQVLSLSGEILAQNNWQQEKRDVVLNLDHLSAGLYLVRVTDDMHRDWINKLSIIK
ncbi:MAG: T9SS type A sorting domain-containing protein [Chitinophagales bacterium]